MALSRPIWVTSAQLRPRHPCHGQHAGRGKGDALLTSELTFAENATEAGTPHRDPPPLHLNMFYLRSPSRRRTQHDQSSTVTG